MMGFLTAIPRGLFVSIVLVVGLILIFIANPPHTVCDSQVETFQANQRVLLFPQTIKGITEKPRLLALEKACREANSSGGCYEWIMALHKVTGNLLELPQECGGKVMALDPVRGVLDRSLTLLARLAWGDKAPASPYERQGWLEETDLVLFCKLVQVKNKFEGTEAWEQYRGHLIMKLPGADALGFNEAWRRSVVSTDCRKFL